jgi:glycosyltransferase involved in cell wall biosynthesis
MNRIKLLKFVTLLGIGGTERQVVNLGLGLDPACFDVRFACFRRWGHFLTDLEARHIPLVQYSIQSLYRPHTLKEQLRCARSIRRDQIQIVHTYNFYANIFGVPAARLAGTPVIVASMRDTGIGLRPMQKRAQKVICRLADCILVNAEAIRQWLIGDGYNPEKITVIRNGIDLSRFGRNARASRLREELGLPAQAPVVAVLSRLDHRKGLEYFLEAAAMIAQRIPQARFLIVGDGFLKQRNGGIVADVAYRRQLEHYATRLGLGGRIVFTGFRLDVPELLSEVAVSVLPSLSEGLSNVLLESMAAGVPVVATRVGGNPEAVEEGVTGFLVPPRDAPALAHAMRQILENRELAARFGEAGRRRVLECFSTERMVRETEHLYLRLLEHKLPGAYGEGRFPAFPTTAPALRPSPEQQT